jgi:hypothetical protein
MQSHTHAMPQAETDAKARVSARTYAFSANTIVVFFGYVQWGLTSLSVIQLAVPAERGCYSTAALSPLLQGAQITMYSTHKIN